ncbi:hypothetical protein IL992_09520 [Microbispora sp. NEAU-D428]|uniref:hypothetical protein n=1 Tax=Microbispora sitophila TaxID=2771537 RepID=UPI0018672309|nr:hypothetical protein [Microbispora sitophila]MBE3009436.1 hypothetical protein [Microbispora sitophila]
MTGVVGPVLSVVVFTAAGAFRPLIPRSPLHPLHVGGLLERADFAWHYAWYAAFGYRLFRGPLDAADQVGPVGPRHA